jgi:heptosyltransferase-2
MNINLLRKIDRHIGIEVVRLQNIWRRRTELPKNPKKILIIKLFGFGNFIFLAPMIKSLRKIFPDAEIDVFTFEMNRQICRMYPDIIDNTKTVRYSILGILGHAMEIISNKKKYDIIIDCEQFVRLSAIIGRLMRPKYFFGIATLNSKKLKAYDGQIIYEEDKHVVEEYYDIARFFARHYSRERSIEIMPRLIPPSCQSSAKTSDFLKWVDGRILLGFCIGGREENKTKRYPHFDALIKMLVQEDNIAIYLLGSKNESEELQDILDSLKPEERTKCMNLSGKLSLAESAYILSRSRMLISNDTGPIHLAAALGTYCVGIYGPTPERIYGPYTSNSMIFRGSHKPVLDAHNEKSNPWNPAWWPDPEKIYKHVKGMINKKGKE